MAKTETIHVTDLRRLYKKVQNKVDTVLKRPFKDTRGMFTQLALTIDRDAMMTFKKQGEWEGRTKWQPFSSRTLQTDAGTWKIRYGTDLKGRPKGTYTPGVLRKGIRRYSGSSKLLQAGGGFRMSFGVQKLTMKSMRYGTVHRLAEDIMSSPERQVIQFTEKDQKRYGTLLVRWIKGKL